MLAFTLATVPSSCHIHSLFDHFQFALIHAPNLPGSYAILLITSWNLATCTQLHIPISCVRIFIQNISSVNNEYSFALHICLKRIDSNSVLGTKKIIQYCLFRNSINHVLQLKSVEVCLNFSDCLLSICYFKSNTITQKMIDFLNCCCSTAKLCLSLCDPITAASQPSLFFTIS